MSTIRPAGILGSARAVLGKDLLLEWRTRARLNALLFFALITLLMFWFASSSDPVLLRRNAGGYLWLAVLFASILSLGESFRVETENGALDGLRLAPTDARGVFLGKALSNAVLLFGLSVVLIPVMMALYDVRLAMGPGLLLLTLGLGALAISAPGTVHSAIATNVRARDVLLPVLLFPLLVPALLSGVRATSLIIQGDPQGDLPSWLGLLTAFNLIYWGIGVALFPAVLEE
ncbi:MAG TPA: heme exporter protein CcmB [Myxococcaceae bacterium]|nr:heme exporter protein CcmB [Myxococcaceae bacterium]